MIAGRSPFSRFLPTLPSFLEWNNEDKWLAVPSYFKSLLSVGIWPIAINIQTTAVGVHIRYK